MEERDKLSIRDAYLCLFRLYADAEMVTWTRFNNFLVFNSILILTWATLWTAGPKGSGGVPGGIFLAVGVLGIVSGLVWGALGHRGRTMQYEIGDVAQKVEADGNAWRPGQTEDAYWNKVFKFAPVSISKRLSDTGRFRWIASKVILTWGPVAVAGLHGVLLAYALGGLR